MCRLFIKMTPVTVRTATVADIPLIQQLAAVSFRATYSEILLPEQTDYMMGMMYNTAKLHEQIVVRGHRFFIAEGIVPIGFAACELNHGQEGAARLHKLYLLPEAQGKGAGKAILDAVTAFAVANKQNTLELNVNRHNKAKAFYERNGFQTVRKEDIAIGQGYFMNDFVMEKELSPAP